MIQAIFRLISHLPAHTDSAAEARLLEIGGCRLFSSHNIIICLINNFNQIRTRIL